MLNELLSPGVTIEYKASTSKSVTVPVPSAPVVGMLSTVLPAGVIL